MMNILAFKQAIVAGKLPLKKKKKKKKSLLGTE